MAEFEDKENFAPLSSSDPLGRHNLLSPAKKPSRKGRSKSIGPGGFDEAVDEKKQDAKNDAKNRRKSTYVAATKAIISADAEKAARQAARRKTLANRRVSFAPEATLHTWDVIEFMRDPTTSTDSSDNTRRESGQTNSDADDDSALLNSASPSPEKKKRRSSGIPPMNFNNPEDDFSSSEISGSSEVESEGEEMEEVESGDETGTAMSLDIDNNTAQSLAASDSSTGSSARLEASLRQAADLAGTRGIEYDEYGDGELSMEIAGDEVTNAFKPWAQENERAQNGPASNDQENVNPFSPMFKAQLASGEVAEQSTIEEEESDGEETGDMSMDVTRAVGGIMRGQAQPQPQSSPLGDGTMDITQAVGLIHNNAGQKRRRSTTEAGSPGSAVQSQSKRRRSSVARSSMGDDTMDLTMAVGGIQKTGSPQKVDRRKSVRRQSVGTALEQDDATMDFTQAIGAIKAADRTSHTSSSFDENEELTMELTTALGGIPEEHTESQSRPVTPRTSQSPVRKAANTTPKDQERFRDTPDYSSKKLLTPLFEKQVLQSADKRTSGNRQSSSPLRKSRLSIAFDLPEPRNAGDATPQNAGTPRAQTPKTATPKSTTPKVATPNAATPRAVTPRGETPKTSPFKDPASYPKLPTVQNFVSPVRTTPRQSPSKSPVRTPKGTTPKFATPADIKEMLDAQLNESQPSPSVARQQRSSPAKDMSTPQKANGSQEARSLAENIKLMNTPRKEVLKNFTPKKQAAGFMSPPKMATPKMRPTPKAQATARTSPMRHLSNDLLTAQPDDQPVEKIRLQNFLEGAGIRFMELTATKRRLTTAPTPSKARRAGDGSGEYEPEVDLEGAVVAAACTTPELEMYKHACHELKHYISDGKKVIKQLENDTFENTPPLIQAYQNASSPRRTALDAQMRDMKTHARYRSKEMWYAWRSQLLEDLMKALSGIGEGLLKDDEALQEAEQILDAVLPGLIEQQETLQQEAERLEEAASATNEDEKEELDAARERIVQVDAELEAKRRILEELQNEAQEHDSMVKDLQDNKTEFTAAIHEADRVREACRGVSLAEISSLKEAITNLEETYGWMITSASSSPPTITMTYKSQLQLYFHPAAFQSPSDNSDATWTNAPISLTFIGAESRKEGPKELTTTLRFFLQLLRASLQGLPQCSTKVANLLQLVSNGWDTAIEVAETERRLSIEGLTAARIVSDERMAIEAILFLPKVRTKVRIAFEILAGVAAASDEEDAGLALTTELDISTKVVYGQEYNEAKMTKVLRDHVGQAMEGWDGAVMDLKAQLVAQGAKASRK